MTSNNQEFSRYTVLDSQPATGTDAAARPFLAQVFMWMFVALGICTLMAVLCAFNPSFSSLMYEVTPQGKSLTGLGLFFSISPVLCFMVVMFAFRRLSAPMLSLLFLLYAATLGMSLSVLLLVYTQGSVVACFSAAAVMFGIMAILGYTTKQDLTSFGRLLYMGLIGIVVASLINMFLGSPAVNYIISIIGVAVFTGLTAYDVQKLKRIGAGLEFEGTSVNDTNKLAIMGAFTLFLDFINLFIMLLSLFGNRKDS